MTTHFAFNTLLALTLTCGAASLARAQTPPPAPANGPLVLERINPSFLVSPDVKITDVDGQTGVLAGFTAGWVQEDTLFMGGSGYWLTNGSENDLELAYGGFTIGWMTPPERRFQVGTRGLIGFGGATLGTDFTVPIYAGERNFRDHPTPTYGTARYGVHEDFFVFEPMATFGAALNRRLRLDVSAGYRVTGGADVLGDRVNGATGSIGLQVRLN
jgi:hypothetical protein